MVLGGSCSNMPLLTLTFFPTSLLTFFGLFPQVASESFFEMKDTIFNERQRRQYSEVAEAAQRIFDNTSLRMLIRTMATNAESILMRDYMNRLASGLLGVCFFFSFFFFFL